MTLQFNFGGVPSAVQTSENPPSLKKIIDDFGLPESGKNIIIVCDENTEYIASAIKGKTDVPVCRLESGEIYKTWDSVEEILFYAKDAGLGRDGLFIGVGGGVITDLTGFAASIYMRGARLALVPTTLLAMVDASIGGKTGFDLFDRKNLAGTFYPASQIYIPLSALNTLSPCQLKSGFAEVIKCAILEGTELGVGSWELGSKGGEVSPSLQTYGFPLPPQRGSAPQRPAGGSMPPDPRYPPGTSPSSDNKEARSNDFNPKEVFSDSSNISNSSPNSQLTTNNSQLIMNAIKTKGRIVESDPKETGTERALLNLGHTFGHALEAASGFEAMTHGEAVAWGIFHAAELGRELGITPPERAERIISLLKSYSYETAKIHPAIRAKRAIARFNDALLDDKKKKNGAMRFIVPNKNGAEIVCCDWELKF